MVTVKYDETKKDIIVAYDGNFGRVHEEVVTEQVIQAMSEFNQSLMDLVNVQPALDMNRVVVPKHSFIEEDEDGHLVEYEVWKCPKCKAIVGGDLVERRAYCQGCGCRILWGEVKK